MKNEPISDDNKIDFGPWDNIDISKKGFENSLNKAASTAWSIAHEYVFNHLPKEMRYLVHLGCSYDDNPLSNGEVTYPEDYKISERTFTTQTEIVALLWRDGRVPEWVDVQVYDADKNYTYIKLMCCGRFSADKRLLYHPHEDIAPFHVLGTVLPPEFVLESSHKKYDLHWGKNILRKIKC